jgi:hypothetical protein
MTLMTVSFVFGLLSCLCPVIATLLLRAAIENGDFALWLMIALPMVGVIVSIIGFTLRKKGSRQVKDSGIPPGLNFAVRFIFGYFGTAANVIGLLYNVIILVAVFVVKQKFGL